LTEIQFAARSGAQFGLPVIQLMADAIEAHAKLMRTVNDAEVLAGGETVIVAQRRDPALIVADRGVAGDIEKR